MWKYTAAIFLTATWLVACSDDSETPSPQPPSPSIERTVLVYAAAQNSLGSQRQFSNDSTEMMAAAGTLREQDRLVVFVDDQYAPRIYEITHGCKAPRLVRQWSEDVNSASAATLRDVVDWTAQNYPSQEYGLVMWSHATGWLPSPKSVREAETSASASAMSPPASAPKSFGIDVGTDGNMSNNKGPAGSNPDEMEVSDMAEALQQSGVRLKYILFDVCLMQNIEVCYALRSVTDYVIGSPMSISAEGGYYTALVIQGLFSADPTDIVTTYHAAVAGLWPGLGADDFGIVISAVRTDKLDALAQAVREALPTSTLCGHASPDMAGVQAYAAYSSSYYYRPHAYDLNEALAHVLPPDAYRQVKSCIDDAVVARAATERIYVGPGYWTYRLVNQDSYCGVSMFVPQDVYADNATRCVHGNLNEQFTKTAWYDAAGWAQTGW